MIRLSKLQKQILLLAYQNRLEGSYSKTNDVDLYSAEIMAYRLSFPRNRRHYSTGGQRFKPSEVGKKKYNALKASTARSLKRLEEKGLVIRYYARYSNWAGIALTDLGMDMAKNLTVNTREKIPYS